MDQLLHEFCHGVFVAHGHAQGMLSKIKENELQEQDFILAIEHLKAMAQMMESGRKIFTSPNYGVESPSG